MLKRLSDQQDMDSLDERLADLLRSAAPFEADPFRKRRVLVRLSRVQTRHAAPFWLRPAVVAMLLVSGTATAALGHRYVAHGTGLFGFGPAVSDSSGSSGSSAASSVRSAARTAGASHAGAVSTSGADAAAAPPVITAPTAADALDPPAGAQHSPSKGSARARSGSGEDATHVVEAI